MSEDNPVRVECSVDFQGVTLWLGDGAPFTVDDRMSARDVRGYVEAPLQRAAVVARLRAIAAMLDDPMGDLVDSATSQLLS